MNMYLYCIFIICTLISVKCRNIVQSDFIAGVSTVVGPDTYGVLQDYKDVYARWDEYDVSGLTLTTSKGISGTKRSTHRDGDSTEGQEALNGFSVDISKYRSFIKSLNDLENEIHTKYRRVNSTFMSTSRFYYNYRHSGNVFAVMSSLLKFGNLSNNDTQVVVPETCLCHPTNTAMGRLYVNSSVNKSEYKGKLANDSTNVFLENTKVTFKGHLVSKDSFRYLVTNRFPKKYPNSYKTYTSDDFARFIYVTGHGGDSYLQFQAKTFISSAEYGLYHLELGIKEPKLPVLSILDTCQASTMYEKVDKGTKLAWIASSIRGESSYSHNPNHFISVSTVDKFTFILQNHLRNVMQGIMTGSKASVSRFSLHQLLRTYQRENPKDKLEYEVHNSMGKGGNSDQTTENPEDTDAEKNLFIKYSRWIKGTLSQLSTAYTFSMSTNRRSKDGISVNYGKDKKKTEKLYLGQFAFNYRKLYYNSIPFPYGGGINTESQKLHERVAMDTHEKYRGSMNASTDKLHAKRMAKHGLIVDIEDNILQNYRLAASVMAALYILCTLTRN
ncbi:gpi-anchor transamidase, putative [Theileria equi strain WA]|uniref:Gpi-anchor transamidase, putative n=1 Tax=Theileria equi strain WA TaxID=1537102 RepID=L1LGC3_THEEQ|nr:gpi-anchor transamidase, putative [Theileria equi strain WA]EKX74411.1 gpi-anchor transamidase, putative [Theileria equi strain WA]|eukprot:XP_004833863.1 gpi-anchor transamidase, putative [Theileria equi strain WA]